MTCSVAGCTQPTHRRDLCAAHYRQARKVTAPRCSIDGCDRARHAHGMCNVHYGRLRYHGDPFSGGRERLIGADREARFWALVDRGAPDECWPWKASLTPNGYGVFCWDAGRVAAHRMALELAQGFPPPMEMDVDHVCHTLDTGCFDVPCAHRACCNPAHLEAVTHAENCRRGRRNVARTGPN